MALDKFDTYTVDVVMTIGYGIAEHWVCDGVQLIPGYGSMNSR